jgi:cytochrome c2
MHCLVVGLNLLVVGLVATLVSAQNSDVAAGKALYQEQCSSCHGIITSAARHRWHVPAPWQPGRMALVPPVRPLLTSIATTGQVNVPSTASAPRLAVAPPYGPSLRGVYGRPAGSVPGFPYSQAFKDLLHGTVWNHETLDRWITDSQAWVPGSRMFYAQPDPAIRRKIITYLTTL